MALGRLGTLNLQTTAEWTNDKCSSALKQNLQCFFFFGVHPVWRIVCISQASYQARGMGSTLGISRQCYEQAPN